MQTEQHSFFSALRKNRLAAVRVLDSNNMKVLSVIADIYSTQTRFMYELLQNADDAQAKKAHFQLMKNQLLMRHDGKAVFSPEDVDSITNVGNSTKPPDEGKIGKFGIGFKSVHSVTKTPRIHSGEFHFKIEDYIVPDRVPHGEIPRMEESETLIILPFDHPKRSPEDAHSLTLKQLNDLNVNCLLFLRNVEEISWQNENEEPVRHRKILGEGYTVLKRDNGESGRYLIYQKDAPAGGYDRTVNVAYKVNIDEHGQESIVPAAEENIFVFFPTATPSSLKFIVQAPYKTTLNRESIDFDDEENHQLTKEMAGLAAETLEDLKKRNLLTPNFFLKILPRIADGGKKTPSDVISNKLADVLRREALLPAHSGSNHVKAEDALLPLDEGLVECLGSEDIKALFGRTFWLPSAFRGISGPLKDIGVKSVSTDLLLDVLPEHENFVQKKDDEWLIGLYAQLEKHIESGGYRKESRKEKVGKTPIIRLDKGEMVAPWGEDNKPQVYLPYDDERKSEFRTVKQSIAKSSDAGNLFEILGISQPDALSEIKEKIAPRYQEKEHGTELDQYLTDINNICATFADANNSGRAEIKNILKNSYMARTSHGGYANPSSANVYLPSKDVKTWFEDNHDVYIVDEGVVGEIKAWEFFEHLGCKKIDGIAKNTGEYSVHKPYLHHAVGVDGFNPEFAIDGLGYAVKYINLQRSRILWRQLLKHYKHIKGSVKSNSNRNFLHSATPEEKHSEAGVFLLGSAWLYDKRENMLNPDEYAGKNIDDLHDSYDKGDRAESLAIAIGLSRKWVSADELIKKTDEARQEEAANWAAKLENSEKEKRELKDKIRQLEREKQKSGGWIPECEPGQGELVKVKPGGAFSRNGGGRHGGETSPNEGEHEYSSPTDPPSVETPSQEVGEWGEKDVYLFLKKRGHDVEWCNERGEKSNPYDIVIKDGESEKYVEVKSTRLAFPHSFNFTDKEWKFAEKNGDNYRVYFVSNVGTAEREYVMVENPVAKHVAGSLNVTVNKTITRRVHIKKSGG